MDKKYEVPVDLMTKIATIIGALPYNQVAQMASELGKLISDQNKKWDESGE